MWVGGFLKVEQLTDLKEISKSVDQTKYIFQGRVRLV